MKAKELRIGNIIENGIISSITNTCIWIDSDEMFLIDELQPIALTDEWLIKFGFQKIIYDTYINGFKYFLHCEGLKYEDHFKQGTYFDGIGKFINNGELLVNAICRGNYICDGVEYVHELQNLYFSLTGKDLDIKTKTNN